MVFLTTMSTNIQILLFFILFLETSVALLSNTVLKNTKIHVVFTQKIIKIHFVPTILKDFFLQSTFNHHGVKK